MLHGDQLPRVRIGVQHCVSSKFPTKNSQNMVQFASKTCRKKTMHQPVSFRTFSHQLPVHVSQPSSILQYHPKIPSLQHMCKKKRESFPSTNPSTVPQVTNPNISPPLREMITSTLMNRHNVKVPR